VESQPGATNEDGPTTAGGSKKKRAARAKVCRPTNVPADTAGGRRRARLRMTKVEKTRPSRPWTDGRRAKSRGGGLRRPQGQEATR